ncbi:MAG TPA: tyrosine--tRNA ligase, partial [Parachlamydiaceae bacterium]|nr:tyrosine--tRNA ligase [Parachlamydiaceae bacterium]
PTSDSLHLGSMVPIMGLAWFQRCGHTPVALAGGATGMIGDPSGKAAERKLLDAETIEKNLKGIGKNLSQILNQNESPALFVNNYDWFKDFSFIDFLRDVGKNFRIGSMLAKESVKLRLNSEEGMSFTEFCYQALQGYDFLHLYENMGVSIQLGGSDQWGNITAGTDLIRKVHGKQAFGITFPLMTRSDGQKFGKSEKGAIWLSEEKLSPYEFYQYLVRVPDADVIRLMSLLTFMEMDEIRRYEKMMLLPDYIPNTAQKRLAEEVTLLVHGDAKLKAAMDATETIKPGAKTVLNAEILENIASDIPSQEFDQSKIEGTKLVDLLAETSLVSSKGEGRRLLQNGGVYLNNERIEDEQYVISKKDLINERLMLLAAGKKNKLLVRVKN